MNRASVAWIVCVGIWAVIQGRQVCAVPPSGSRSGDRALSDAVAGQSLPGSTYYPDGGMRREAGGSFRSTPHALITSLMDTTSGKAYFASWSCPIQFIRVDPSTSAVEDVITMEEGENLAESSVLDPIDGKAYIGTDRLPGRVIKVDLATFTREAAITLGSTEGYLDAAVLDPASRKAYFATERAPARIIKIDLDTFSREAVLTLPAGDNYIRRAAIDSSTHTAYFGTGGSSPERIIRVDLNTFTRTGAIYLASGESPVECAFVDEAHGKGYFGVQGTPGKLVKVDLPSFTREATLTDPLTLGFTDPVFDSATAKAYMGGRSSSYDWQVGKIDLGTFSVEGALTQFEDNDSLYSCSPVPFGGKACFANTGLMGYPTRIVTVDLASLSKSSEVALEFSEDHVKTGVVDPATGKGYFGLPEAPGIIVKMDMATLTREAELSLPVLDFKFSLLDAVARKGYFVGWGGGPAMVKLDLETFTHEATLSFPYMYGTVESGVIDPGRGKMYFGVGWGPNPGVVSRVDLASFSEETTISLGSVQAPLMCAALDQANGKAYFVGYTAPGRIAKIDLATFTLESAGTLLSGDNYPIVAAPDFPHGKMYLATGTAPGRVLRVNLATLTREASLSIPTGTDSLTCGMLFEANHGAFFGISSLPGQIAKVDLDAFAYRGALTLSGSDWTPLCAIPETDQGKASFGLYTDPGRVVRVGLTQRGYLKASRLTMSEAGRIKDVRFYSHVADGSVRLALYDNGQPKRLVWESDAVPNTMANDVLIVPISQGAPSSLKLGPGTFWLAWQIDSYRDVPSYRTGPSQSGFWMMQPFGPAPASLDSSQIVTTAEQWTEYLTYDTPPGTAATTWTHYR